MYRQIIIKICSMKFRENPLSDPRVISCIQTDGLTDETIIEAFGRVVNAPERFSLHVEHQLCTSLWMH
jgi:hypothetical protein